MRSFFDTWRRHLWLWVLPLAFCVLNLLGVAFYHAVFAGQVERLESRFQAASNKLTKGRDEYQIIEDFLSRIESHEAQVEGLHRDHFETEERRFTRAIREILSLARQAGLNPSSLSYPKKTFSGHDLVQRKIVLPVSGSYDQLRNFINFLELTDHFFILNSVGLGESGKDERNPTLSIKLTTSTIFTTREIELPEEPET